MLQQIFHLVVLSQEGSVRIFLEIIEDPLT